jgi:rhodanese-related sulfurtransferase
MFQEVPAWRASEVVGRGAQLVDVRERDEIATGTHPGAIAIPLSELERRTHELSPDRPVALLCRSGNRSRQATELLTRRGFRSVANLAGGIEAARRNR